MMLSVVWAVVVGFLVDGVEGDCAGAADAVLASVDKLRLESEREDVESDDGQRVGEAWGKWPGAGA